MNRKISYQVIHQFLPLSFVRNSAFQRTWKSARFFDGTVGAHQSPTEAGGASLVSGRARTDGRTRTYRDDGRLGKLMSVLRIHLGETNEL